MKTTAQRVLPNRKPNAKVARTHPGQAAASARKRRNRTLRAAELVAQAETLGMSVDQLRHRLYLQVLRLRGKRQEPASVPAPLVPRESSISGGRVTWDGYGSSSFG